MTSFYQTVYAIVARIPRGKAASYGQIAALAGKPRAAREVGWAMRNCPDNLPWQRVVLQNGEIAGGEFASVRKALLMEEGVPFLADGRVDMRKCRWTPEAD